MGHLPFTNPGGNANLMVEQMLGEAYKNVKTVAERLDEVGDVADLIEEGLQLFGARGSIFGLTHSNNTDFPNTHFNIGPGHCRDRDTDTNMQFPVGMIKRLDANWAPGTGMGALDSGIKSPDKWYFTWAIKNTNTDAVDYILSLSATNPHMPDGWVAKRRIMSCIGTDALGNIRPVKHRGSYVGIKTPFSGGGTALGTGENNGNVLRNLPVPIGVPLRIVFSAYFGSALNTAFFAVKDADEGIATTSDFKGYSAAAGQNGFATGAVFCNANGQVYTFSNRADCILTNLYIQGWYDQRGGEYEDF